MIIGYIVSAVVIIVGYLLNIKIGLTINKEVANQWAITYFLSLINELVVKPIIMTGLNLSLMFYIGKNRSRCGCLRKFMLKLINEELLAAFIIQQREESE